MFSLSDLIKPKTRDEIVDEMLSLAATFQLAVTSWQPGAVVRTMLVLVGQKLSDFTSIIVEPIKGGFGDLLSSPDWAQAWAKGQFDVDMVQAAPATGTVTATNSSVTAYPLNPGDLIVAHATSGKTYRNTAPITIPGSGSLADIAISSDQLGTDNDAAPGAITVLVAPALIGVTVTNPAAVLGADQETVSALILRSRAKWGALSPNGPKSAYDYVATTPALSPTAAPITRSRTLADPATGIISVYIATADGAPTSPDVTIVDNAIHEWAEPWATTADAHAATNHTIAVTYHAWVKGSNLTSLEIQTAIATALAEYFKSVPIGGVIIPPATGMVYVENLEVVISNATPGVVKVTIAAPSGDVSIGDSEVAVLGTITPTITLI